MGHGNSEGDRVHVESFDTYVQDIVGHIEDVKKQYPGVPSMLMGHSMVRNKVHMVVYIRHPKQTFRIGESYSD